MTPIPSHKPERPYKSTAEVRMEQKNPEIDPEIDLENDQAVEAWMDQLIDENRSTLETLASL